MLSIFSPYCSIPSIKQGNIKAIEKIIFLHEETTIVPFPILDINPITTIEKEIAVQRQHRGKQNPQMFGARSGFLLQNGLTPKLSLIYVYTLSIYYLEFSFEQAQQTIITTIIPITIYCIVPPLPKLLQNSATLY